MAGMCTPGEKGGSGSQMAHEVAQGSPGSPSEGSFPFLEYSWTRVYFLSKDKSASKRLSSAGDEGAGRGRRTWLLLFVGPQPRIRASSIRGAALFVGQRALHSEILIQRKEDGAYRSGAGSFKITSFESSHAPKIKRRRAGLRMH